MRLQRRGMLTALVVLASVAGADSARADGLPFGLDAISWTMSLKDFAARLSLLAPSAKPDSHQITNQAASVFGPYRWRDCSFEITGRFAEGRLANVYLDAHPASADCRHEAQEELKSRYGDGAASDMRVMKTGKKFGTHIEWTSPDTKVVYNDSDDGGSAEIGLLQKGGPPLIVYDTVP